MKETQTNEASRLWVPPELVAQAKAGDQAAFTELYELTSAGLYRTIHSMVRDEDLAWDIQQDSYLQAFHNLDRLEANGAFLSWLRRIAVNVTAKKMSQRRTLTFTELAGEEDEGEPEIPDLDPDAQPELALDRKETARLVREILSGLPESQQMILGMYYYEDMPIREIADTLHVSQGTVKSQLSFGRKKVEAGVRALEKQGVKLYGLSPLPFLLALLRRLEPAAGAEKKVLSAVLAEAPAAAGTSAVTVTALTAGQAFLKGLAVKLIAVAAAAALLVGGKLGYDAAKRGEIPCIGVREPQVVETIDPAETGELWDVSASGEPEPAEPYSGVCGDELTWRFDVETRTLILEGSGNMYDFIFDTEDEYPPPWTHLRQFVQSLVLPGGLTSIGARAFTGCVSLSSVTIPDNVTDIHDGAFDYTGLTALTIPEGVTTIGKESFSSCGSLTFVSIPESLTEIGTGAFGLSSSLTSFSIHPENRYFSAGENGALYSKDQTRLIACPCGFTGHFIVPASVTVIEDCAFESCRGLTDLTIPEGVIAIGEYAFGDCQTLTDLTLPASLTQIGSGAFMDCLGLRSVTFSEGITRIPAGLFHGCSSLISVTIPESVTDIDGDAFIGCSALRSITIPKNLSVIGESVFAYCTDLTAISVDPANPYYSTDEYGVFYDKDQTALIACPGGLRGKYVIPDGVTSICGNAFRGCSALTSVTIPDSCGFIEDNAFYVCGLTSVTIPEGVSYIGDYAFCGCSDLASVTFSDGLSHIGAFAFSRCAMNTVSLPESLSYIGAYAFSDCPNLIELAIPEGIASILWGTFESCNNLTRVKIPDSVSSIEGEAFRNCTNLRSLTIPEGVTYIDKSAFIECENLTIRGVPGSEAERYADENGIPFEALP